MSSATDEIMTSEDATADMDEVKAQLRALQASYALLGKRQLGSEIRRLETSKAAEVQQLRQAAAIEEAAAKRERSSDIPRLELQIARLRQQLDEEAAAAYDQEAACDRLSATLLAVQLERSRLEGLIQQQQQQRRG